MVTYLINPCPKPRMTGRDRWAKRAVVLKYFAFKDECQRIGVSVPECGAHVLFVVPMPKSWAKKKKLDMCGMPHQQTPDIDNLLKALLDAVHSDDSGVHDIRATKVWGVYGQIIITTSA